MQTLKRLSLPLCIFFLILIIVFYILDLQGGYESKYILPILGTIFIGINPIIGAFFTGKIYIEKNIFSALLMSCGLLVLGLGSIISGLLLLHPDVHLPVPIFDLCAFVASVFHLIASIKKEKIKEPKYPKGLRKTLLALGYIGICVLVAFLYIVISKLLPQLETHMGVHLMRHALLGHSILLFLAAGLVLIRDYLRKKSDFIYWFAMTSFVFSIGLIGVYVTPVTGGVAGWIGRVAQFFGGAFAVAAVLSAKQSAKTKGTEITDVMVDYFLDAEESYRILVETSEDAIISVDHQFQIFFSNSAAAKMFEYERDELKNKLFLDFFVDDEEKKLLQQELYGFFESGKTELISNVREYMTKTKNGRKIPVEMSVTIRKPLKRFIITCIMRDVTHRKQMEEALKEQAELLAKKNNLITEFFTNISHEFRTPLSIILMQLELMNLFLRNPSKLTELLEIATQNSYRLTRLVSNLLDITRIDAGFAKASFVNKDIVSFVRGICSSVEPCASSKALEIRCDASISEKIMPFDPEKMERIMFNLLSNAIKHTGEGGNIHVHVAQTDGGGVSISVKDTGEGIPKDRQEVIFDRFAQVDSSLSRRSDGCGIGLALVKSLVDLLGGSIHVESEPGLGSEFIIELPLVESIPENQQIDTAGFDRDRRIAVELSDIY